MCMMSVVFGSSHWTAPFSFKNPCCCTRVKEVSKSFQRPKVESIGVLQISTKQKRYTVQSFNGVPQQQWYDARALEEKVHRRYSGWWPGRKSKATHLCALGLMGHAPYLIFIISAIILSTFKHILSFSVWADPCSLPAWVVCSLVWLG